jgi:hypothetical protein
LDRPRRGLAKRIDGDALYLELAMRHAPPLATLDRRLAAACGQAGVSLVGGAMDR